MISWLLSLLGGITPIINKGIDYYLEKSKGDTNLALEMMKADQAANAVRIAGMNHPVWWLGWIGFVAPYAIWTWKVVVYDKVLGLGSTDPLSGMIGEWGGIIVASIFGGSFVLGGAGLIFNWLAKK